MKEKLTKTMFHLIAKQGYDKTALSQVAEAVSIQKASIYYHFKSKEALFLATVREYYQELYQIRGITTDRVNSSQEYQDLFFQSGLHALEQFEANKEHQQFYVEVNLQSLRLPSLTAYFEEYDETTRSDLRKSLLLGQELAAFPANLDVNLELQSLMAMFIGLSEMTLYRMEVDTAQVWAHYCKKLFLL